MDVETEFYMQLKLNAEYLLLSRSYMNMYNADPAVIKPRAEPNNKMSNNTYLHELMSKIP
jgi:hypothetical protein